MSAYATIVVALLVVYLLIGSSEIYIDGPPEPAERIVLTVLVLALPLAALVGWAVARLRSRRLQVVAFVVAVVVAVIAGPIQGGPSHLLGTVVVAAVVLVLTASGVGAVLAWAFRLTVAQLAAMGALFVRSLPVLLLTVVVFFNTYVWLMAATISRTRLWLAVLLLLAVTIAFLVTTSIARVRPMLVAVSGSHHDVPDLRGTPFAEAPDPPDSDPLSRAERLNVVIVLAGAQMAHLLMVAISTAAIYFVLGLILLSPEVLAVWTRDGTSDGTVLGMTIPVPQSLIHMTMLLGVLTFMYVSGRSVGDEDYKRDFLTPLLDNLHATLIARNRYRNGRKAGAARLSPRLPGEG